MALYVIVAALPLLFEAVFTEHERHNAASAKKWRWFYILLSLLPLFALIAFRGQHIGADTGVYLKHFGNVANSTWASVLDGTDRMERGYLIFVKLLTYVIKDARIYQVVCALIYMAAMFTFAIQQKKSPFLFIFFFATLGLYTKSLSRNCRLYRSLYTPPADISASWVPLSVISPLMTTAISSALRMVESL